MTLITNTMANASLPYHFLLDYVDAGRLGRMTDHEKKELVSKIFLSGQTEDSWNALLELFSLWPDNQVKKQAFELAENQLTDWEEDERHINSSWMRIIHNNELSSVALLARRISINRREESGNSELSVIASSPNAANLFRIDIDRSTIYTEGIRALANSQYLQHLTTICINGVSFSDDNFLLLLNPAKLESLLSLALTKCGITGKRTDLLLHSKLAPQLETLNLSRNTVGDEGAIQIASSGSLSRLRILDMGNNFITDIGAVALAASLQLVSLQQLILTGNTIKNPDEIKNKIPKNRNIRIII